MVVNVRQLPQRSSAASAFAREISSLSVRQNLTLIIDAPVSMRKRLPVDGLGRNRHEIADSDIGVNTE
jgi:hypothetical protein